MMKMSEAIREVAEYSVHVQSDGTIYCAIPGFGRQFEVKGVSQKQKLTEFTDQLYERIEQDLEYAEELT